METRHAVHALVADLLLVGPRVDPGDGPALEVERGALEQALRPGYVARYPEGLVGARDPRIPVLQSLLDQVNRDERDVDADPLPADALGSVDGSAAAAERVEYHVAGVAARGQMMRSSSAIGFWVGYPRRSLAVC